MVITSRNPNILGVSDLPKLKLDVFDDGEAHAYIRAHFRAAQHPFDEQSITSLVAEVGLILQQLYLAASCLQTEA